jgi:hypothetical protein
VLAAFRPGRPLPGRLPIRTRLLQEVDGRVLAVPARLSGKPSPTPSSFRPDPAGALAFLGRPEDPGAGPGERPGAASGAREGRPLLSFTLEDFRFRVGFASPRARLG